MPDVRRISRLLPSAICHLPFAICHLPSAICHLPRGTRYYASEPITTYHEADADLTRYEGSSNPGGR
jgi:hypothetical protein